MLSLYEILKASKTGIAPDMRTALAGMNWGGADSGHEVKELTGIPPLSIRSNGTMLLDYLISGNMSQTGTPTPDNPIQPQETGERTENLSLVNLLTGSALSIRDQFNALYTDMIYDTDTQYTISLNFTGDAPTTNGVFKICFTYTDGTTTKSGWITTSNRTNSLTSQSGKTVKNISITNYNYPVTNSEMKNIMLNTGSTALPYEPYGYKITISSANTTTPVYLGEVETTRKIKKLVLTGSETFYRDKERTNSWRFYSAPLVSANYNLSICSHFVYIGTRGVNDTDDIGFSLFSASQFGCRCPKSVANTVNEFKAWLAAQYAAGTPVIIWYILATPETAVVNEPLRKIGNYADTLSYEQAGVHIPTLHGNTVIDVETTLKPSQMYIKYQE